MLNTLFTKQCQVGITSLFTRPLKWKILKLRKKNLHTFLHTTVMIEDCFPVTTEFYHLLVSFWSENCSELTFNHFPMDIYTQFTVLIKTFLSFSWKVKQVWHLKLTPICKIASWQNQNPVATFEKKMELSYSNLFNGLKQDLDF